MTGKSTLVVSLVVAASSLLRGGSLHGDTGSVDDDKAMKVKAAYLLNFAKFVTWPADAFQDEHSPILIGIVGTNPFGSWLDQTIKDKTVAGRPLRIRHLPWRMGDGVSAVKQCHLLYISPSLGQAATGLMTALGHAPILLVGEGTEFAKYGGTLGFVMEEGRIVFWANKKAAEAARLHLSSQLLKLARPVEGATVAQNLESAAARKGD